MSPTPRKNPHAAKRAARGRLRKAVDAGRVERRPCESCGAPAQAHHEDYAQPLIVRWLCPRHHMAEHRDAMPDTRGTANGQAKITDDMARSIRVRYAFGRARNRWARGRITQRALAREYGISQGQVHKIIHGERWQWLE